MSAGPLKRRSGGKTVLSLDGQWLKLVHVGGLGSARTVDLALAESVQGLEDPEVLKSLTQKIHEEVGLDPGLVLIANPSQFTTVRMSSLPSTDPDEIRQIVELQAERYTPYAKEEILTGFKVIDQDANGYSRVLLAISHRDVVGRSVTMAEGLGWGVTHVGSDLEGLANWYLLSGNEAHSPSGAVLLADVDRGTTTLLILKEGRPYFHRSIACGVSHLAADAIGGTTTLVGEFQRSLEAFEGEGFNFTLSEVILTGLAERVTGLKESLQQTLNLPTSILPTASHLPLSPEAKAQLEAGEVSFAGLIGLGLGPSHLDLTPPSVRLRRAFESRARALVMLGGQVAAVLLLLCCLALEKSIRIQHTHAQVAQEATLLAREAEGVGKSLDQLHVIQGRLHQRGQLLEILATLSDRLPPEIRLDSLAFSGGEGIVLKGVSSELPKVYELVSELGKLPLFTEVTTRRVSKRKQEDSSVTDFEVACSLGLGGK